MLFEPREALLRTSTFVLAAGQPAAIDLTTVYEGDSKQLQTKAIYAFHDDVLTYCIGAPGQPRPTEFSTSNGDQATLVVLKRIVPDEKPVNKEVGQ